MNYIDKITEIQAKSIVPLIDPTIVAAAQVGSAVFGAISAANSFRQVAELKEINKNLKVMISLQKKTLLAIKDLGIKFERDLERAFIRDTENELNAYFQTYNTISNALVETSDGLKFPDDGPNYKDALEDIMWKSITLTNKLAEYGTIAYNGVVAGIGIVESMFKIINLSHASRRSFLEDKLPLFKETSIFFDNENKLIKTKQSEVFSNNSYTEDNFLIVDYGAPYPRFKLKGNPKEGYHACFIGSGTTQCVGEWNPVNMNSEQVCKNPKFSETCRLVNAHKNYIKLDISKDNLTNVIIPSILDFTSSTQKIILMYS